MPGNRLLLVLLALCKELQDMQIGKTMQCSAMPKTLITIIRLPNQAICPTPLMGSISAHALAACG
jgi:hypothetical protein